MAIGPVQLIVPGINHPASTVRSSPNWSGSTRAARSGVIDSLAVYKDTDGEASDVRGTQSGPAHRGASPAGK